MNKAQVELSDAVYRKVEDLAMQLHLTVPEVLRQAAEQMLLRQVPPQPKSQGDWSFPEGRRLGAFCAPVEDWRLLANEAAD